MRTAKTHIRAHGEKEFKLLHGPCTPIQEQVKAFKALRVSSVNEKIAEVHYQESDGSLRVFRFLKPEEKKSKIDAAKARSTPTPSNTKQ